MDPFSVTLLPAVFAASLVGSMHCVGMCGPLLAVVVGGGSNGEKAPSTARLQAAYHGARGVGYVVLGAAAGTAGHLADLGSTLAGLQPVAALLAAAALILTGAAMLARHFGWNVPHAKLPTALATRLRGLQRRAMGLPPATRALAIGASTTLLPCGWLYAFAAVAAGTGNPLAGAFVMAAFWLGSVPLLAVLGFGVRGAGQLISPRLRPAFSVALIALGIWTLTGRSGLDSVALVQRTDAQSVHSLPDPGETPACCADDQDQ